MDHRKHTRAKPLLNFFDEHGIAHSSGRRYMTSNPDTLPRITKIGGRYYVFAEDEDEWRARRIAARNGGRS